MTSAETWVAICTGAMAVATFLLAFLTYRLEVAWKKSTERQIGIQTWLALQARFDSIEMARARTRLALKLAMYNPQRNHQKLDETVPDFFESLGTLHKQGLIDEGLADSTFGFYACRWWEALKAYIDYERKRHNEDATLFEDFEMLSKVLRRRNEEIDADEIKRFLDDERGLIARIRE